MDDAKTGSVTNGYLQKIKLALLGPGQVFGEDDMIAERNYSSSLVCNANGSQLYAMSKSEFFRIFKSNAEAWKLMFKIAKKKELEQMKRCSNFLNVKREGQA